MPMVTELDCDSSLSDSFHSSTIVEDSNEVIHSLFFSRLNNSNSFFILFMISMSSYKISDSFEDQELILVGTTMLYLWA